MVGMSVGITGDKDLRRRIQAARRSMKNFKPWLKQASLIVIESVQTNFDQGGRPDWVELSKETIRKRGSGKTSGGTVEPLRDTGILMASITSPQAHEDGVYEIDNFSIEVGTSRKHAGTLHHGTKDGHIPPRPFMFMQDIDEKRIETLMIEFLDKSLGPAPGAGGEV
jgi:phage gpG-like protein